MTYRHENALNIIKENSTSLKKTEILPLKRATGKIIAKTYQAKQNIPKYDNAAVDGYALNSKEPLTNEGINLPIALKIAAGDKIKTLKPHTAAHILTGAPVPKNAHTILMQEDVTVENNHIRLPKNLQPNRNIRRAGEDFKKNQTVIAKGQKIRPQDLAALAANGISEIKCHDPIKIKIFSSGNEIVRNTQNKNNTSLFDANYPMLDSLIKVTLNVIAKDGGIIKDNLRQTKERLENATQKYDAIITTGGASTGDKDHIRQILAQYGKIYVDKIAVKPGRPFIFAKLNKIPVFALPGNPVAVMICFLIYTLPALKVMQGQIWQEPKKYPIQTDFTIKEKKQKRREFWRAKIKNQKLVKYPRDGSGLISGLQDAQGLIEVEENITHVKKSDILPFIPFSQFGF